MPARVMITGISSGIGLALAKRYASTGYQVFGISRRLPPAEVKAAHQPCDLANFNAIPVALNALLDGVETLDLVVLNAGILAPIQDLSETPLATCQNLMDVNVWGNKIVLDWLFAHIPRLPQIVIMSSRAAEEAHRGWGAYCVAKSALLMLSRVYAMEYPETHISSFSPGFVDTPMQHYVNAQENDARFPSIELSKRVRGTALMPSAETMADTLATLIPDFRRHPTGAFVSNEKMAPAK